MKKYSLDELINTLEIQINDNKLDVEDINVKLSSLFFLLELKNMKDNIEYIQYNQNGCKAISEDLIKRYIHTLL
ncbi:MAG: hypothetical protein RR359_03340 [Bacilli bacterium]